MVPPSSPATSISLTWDQPQATEAIDGYNITYSYQINECIGEGTAMATFVVMLNNGLQRNYTIMSSPDTPVEEDSRYTITITAINSAGRSAQSNTVFTTTRQAGKPCMLLWLHAAAMTYGILFFSSWGTSIS